MLFKCVCMCLVALAFVYPTEAPTDGLSACVRVGLSARVPLSCCQTASLTDKEEELVTDVLPAVLPPVCYGLEQQHTINLALKGWRERERER